MALQRNESGWRQLLMLGLFMTVFALLPSGGSTAETDVDLIKCRQNFGRCFRRFVRKYRQGEDAYNDEKEATYRRGVLRANVDKYIAMEHDPSYHLGLNSLLDQTVDELKLRLLGNLVPPNTSSAEPPSPDIPRRKLLANPSSVDWRTENVLPDIKDQKRCGSCGIFSAVAAVEAIHAIKCGDLISLSEQEVVDCSGFGTCLKGWHSHLAMMWIMNNGITSDSIYPYNGFDNGCNISKKNQPKVFTSGTEWDVNVAEDVMEAWIFQQPHTVYFHVEDDFFGLRNSNTGIYKNRDCPGRRGLHAMLAVGYTSDYWIIRNQWGKGFGENGYLKVARGGPEKGFPSDGVCGVRQFVARPLKFDCGRDAVAVNVGCAANTDVTCDFHFAGGGAKQMPPKFSLGDGKTDRSISSSVVDSKSGKTVATINTNGGYRIGDLPTGEPATAGKPSDQFYGGGSEVKVKTFNNPNSVSGYRNKCVVLPLTSVQLDGGINLNPGDKNTNYPENRRCVIFETL